MAFVSEDLMEKTWQRVGAFDGREILGMQKRHRKVQNPLVMFVYTGLRECGEDAGGLLVYVFHVVLEAFLKVEPRPRRISKRQILNALGKYDSDLPFSFPEARDASPEPHVLDYAFDAFTEVDDVTLSQLEVEAFIAVVQVVIECLHGACQRK